MLFRSTDLLNDFERLTKGLSFGPEFDKVIDDLSAAFTSATTTTPSTGSTARYPANPFAAATKTPVSSLDAIRSAERFQIFVDIPGIDVDAVKVAIDGRTLTIEGERSFDVADGERRVHSGRGHGSFSHVLELDDDLDVESLTARAENGVLIVTVPVIESPEPRKIQITVEG